MGKLGKVTYLIIILIAKALVRAKKDGPLTYLRYPLDRSISVPLYPLRHAHWQLM